MVIIRPQGNIGPFKSIETLADRLRCDGVDYPFSVLGQYTVSNDDALAPAPLVTPPTPDQVADRRYVAEISGTTVNGVAFATTRDSRANLAAAYSFATAEQDFSVNWKTPDGQFVALNAAQIRTAALAVAAHVQACYTREAELLAAIQAGTYQAGDIDLGWPAG